MFREAEKINNRTGYIEDLTNLIKPKINPWKIIKEFKNIYVYIHCVIQYIKHSWGNNNYHNFN